MGKNRLLAGLGAIAIVFLAVCSISGVFLARGHVLGRLYNDVILDNYDHFLPCEKLPTSAEVHRILDENQATVEAIEAVNAGLVWVEVDDYACGRADIVVYYATHRDRLAIEKILGGHTFFGVPCRFRNV